MKQNLLITIILSFIGLISCNSDDVPSKSYIHKDNFKVQPPQLVRSSNQEIVTWNKINKPKSPYLLEDILQFQNKDITKIELQSSCSQDNHDFLIEYSLPYKEIYTLRELLPFEIISEFKSKLITCNFSFVAKNVNKSTHQFSINSIIIDPQEWYPVVQIYDDNLKKISDDTSNFHLQEIKSSRLDLSKVDSSNHLSLSCKGFSSLQLHHPYLELNKLDWVTWQEQFKKNRKLPLSISCRLLVSHKVSETLRPLGWTQSFNIYSPQKIMNLKKADLKFTKNILNFSIPRTSEQNIYVKVNKADLLKSFEIKDGFHLFKSNLANYTEYVSSRTSNYSDFRTPNEPIRYRSSDKMWVSTVNLHKPVLTSKSKFLELVKEDNKSWLFLARGPQPISLQIAFVRPKSCQNVFVEFSQFRQLKELPITLHVDKSEKAMNKPLETILISKIASMNLPMGITANIKLGLKFFNNYPELRTERNQKILLEQRKLMLKNPISQLDCATQ